MNAEEVVASGAVGYADVGQRRPATAKTAYHLFSATKLYTATAVMQLVESGKLQLDDPLTEFLPEYRSTEMDKVTIKHLLSHSSGLKDTMSAFLAVRPGGAPAPTTAEALSRYNMKTGREPGSKVEYRNVNYAILGEIVSRCSGQPYTDYVSEHILRPLDMKAAFSLTETMKEDAATGYLSFWDPTHFLLRFAMRDVGRWALGDRMNGLVELHDYDLDSAAIGGLVGSVEDFALFVIAHLNEGQGILQPDSAQLMQTVAAEGQAGFVASVGVGLGWKIGEIEDRPFLNHEGGGAGFATETRIYPEAGIGIVLAMNLSGMAAHRAAHRICELIYDMGLGQ